MKNTPLNVVQFFFEAANKYPGHQAIVHQNKILTYAQLAKEVRQTLTHFKSKGIKKGDRVLVFVPMGIELYRTVLALLALGATVVFLDEWVSKKRMEACCEIAKCHAFIGIFKARVLAVFSAPLRKIPIKLGVKFDQNSAETPFEIHTQCDHTALITFTTGSTGTPKAAKRTHGFLKEQFDALRDKIDPSPTDVDMPVLPIVLLINLGVGCTSVIADYKASKPHTFKPEKVVALCQQYGVNRMVSSPYFVKTLSEHLLASQKRLPGIEKIFTGGAPVFPKEASTYRQAFPQANIEIVYGSTEAEPISAIEVNALLQADESQAKKGLCVGKPNARIKLKIIGIQSGPISCQTENELNNLVMAEGEIGEIIVSGPHVLREYFNNPSALLQNKIFIHDTCWHRTGDSGFVHRGNLYLTGRCSSLIHFEGMRIAPFVYESRFQQMPHVVMGTLIEHKDKLIAVFELEKRGRGNQPDIIALLNKEGLPIDRTVFLPAMPRDPRHHSKIDYEQLRSLLMN